jgi:hypothetical protein
MPLDRAVRQIAFRPVFPAAKLIAIAAIPGLGNDDSRRTHGIAFEYARRGDALLLSEWPVQQFRIVVGPQDLNATPCRPQAFKADGYIWTTRKGLVMTLQPDGDVPPVRVETEARRLAAGGACPG